MYKNELTKTYVFNKVFLKLKNGLKNSTFCIIKSPISSFCM